MLVGGGGGGSSGGGGGGGVVYQESHSVSATGYSIVVGPGGLGRSGPMYAGQGSTGTPSTAFGYTAGGGGGGGSYNGSTQVGAGGAGGVSSGGARIVSSYLTWGNSYWCFWTSRWCRCSFSNCWMGK